MQCKSGALFISLASFILFACGLLTSAGCNARLTIGGNTNRDAYAAAQNERLGQGVNLGNMLEAPTEGEWGLKVEEAYFDLIADAGFDSVRVPIRWSTHALEQAPYTIDADFFKRIDWVIEQARKRNLAVVVNIHHYEEIQENPRLHKERFLEIWRQVAEHYASQPASVYFELLNEPTGTLGTTSWNTFAQEAITLIRQSNPRRTIIVGPGQWNSISALPTLELPANERNLIVTVHYYDPFQFTHQGAEWAEGAEAWLGTTWNGSDAEKAAVRSSLEAAATWAETNQRPIYLGEFGAYHKADLDSRGRWTSFVARTAEDLGFSWAYWEFGAGFGVYDPKQQTWNESIVQALISK